MRIQVLQHVEFEGPGTIADWAEAQHHQMTLTRLYADEPLPALNSFDFLVVMGGPMGVGDAEAYPWLTDEAGFIRDVAATDKPILGICLGAQLIAAALGAEVSKNKYREIGWFPINIFSTENSKIAQVIPTDLKVFHWHGDTFAIPENAQHFASSEACENQAFVIDERIVGLQFHLEMTLSTAQTLIEKCGDELDGSEFVQSEAQMLENKEYFKNTNKIMAALLDQLVARPIT